MCIHRLNIHKDYSPENCIICTQERHEAMREESNQDLKYTDEELEAVQDYIQDFEEGKPQ